MKKILVLFLLVSHTFLIAQNDYNIRQFIDESKAYVKLPLRWNSNDWLKVGIISAGSLLLTEIDQPVRTEMLKNRSYDKSAVMEFGRYYGELYSPAVFAGVFGLHGLFSDDQSSKKIAFEIVQTTLYAGALTTFLKLATSRARPFTEKGSGSFLNGPGLDDDFLSFPSGHTTVAFSVSTVLAKNAKSDLVKLICYLPAVLTAFSRVYQDKHWTSDVVLGALIGYTVGSYVTSEHAEKELININSPQHISLSIPLN